MNKESKLFKCDKISILQIICNEICENFGLKNIEIEIKELGNKVLGKYSYNHRVYLSPKGINGRVTIHEIIHHVQNNMYPHEGDCHGYSFNLAKSRVVNFMNKKYNANFSHSDFKAYI